MCADSREKILLLTGASGVVGHAVLQHLGDWHAVCLRRTPAEASFPNTSQLLGDVRKPRFGLTAGAFGALAERVDAVIHAAAATDFGLQPQEIREVNVEGTGEVLAFARRADAPVLYVSSVFVERLDAVRHGEPSNEVEAGRDAYLESKIEAEAMVRDSGAAWTVARLPVVTGDTHTGQMARAQGFQLVLRGLSEGTIPFLLSAPPDRMDFVPQDVLARALLNVVEHEVRGDLWLTAGDSALTFEAIIDEIEARARVAGIEYERPRCVPISTIQRLMLPAFGDVLPWYQRRQIQSLLAVASLFGSPTPFASSLGAIPGTSALTDEDLRIALRSTLDPRWFRAPAQASNAGRQA